MICSKCVLDDSVSEITYDKVGVCNYCHQFEELAKKTIWRPLEVRQKELETSLKLIKEKGKNNEYDCVLGVSGGVDSTYLALKAKEWGLRPLVVHFDNGWNSEIAVKNIENLISRLGFDLYTYVIDWEQFRDLQLAFIKASVLDLEMPTDQIIFSALYYIAYKRNIKYVLSGTNISTEAILPRTWYAYKLDYYNLKDINKKFGRNKINKLPKLSLYHKYFYQQVICINSFSPLNLIDYNKEEVKKEITAKLGWQDYGGKHYESTFTKFYQSYILPTKYGIDKRKAHLSNLILTNQITREFALEELKKPLFDENDIAKDIEYVSKKFEMSKDEFISLLGQVNRSHTFFKTENDFVVRFYYKLFLFAVYLPVRLLRLLRILDTPNKPKFY